MKPLVLVLPVLLTACASVDPTRTVHIDSEPHGARIFFGSGPQESDADKTRAFIGTTPLDYKIIGDGEGRFKSSGGALVYSMFVPGACVFTAEPPSSATNLFTKRQVFHSGGIATPPDKIPEGLFFDLTKPK